MHLSPQNAATAPSLATLLANPLGKVGVYYDTKNTILPHGGTILNDAVAMRKYNRQWVEVWFRPEAHEDWDRPEIVIQRALKTINYAPERIDCTYSDCLLEMSPGGSQRRVARLSEMTAWVPVREHPGVHVRLSKARTVGNQFVQRIPVEFGGCVLELTTEPESTDPRRAVAQFMLIPAYDHTKGIPWFSVRKPATVHDLRTYTDMPTSLNTSLGTLPNTVEDRELLLLILDAVRETINITFGSDGK